MPEGGMATSVQPQPDADMQAAMTSGEQVLNVWQYKYGLLFPKVTKVAATNRRIIIKSKSLMGSKVRDYTYEHISSVNFETEGVWKRWRWFFLGVVLVVAGLAIDGGTWLVVVGIVTAALAYLGLGEFITLSAGVDKHTILSRKGAGLADLLRIIRDQRK
jgi:hypothetical protein